MGLSSFPSSAEGIIPALVMNTVLSVALLKNLLSSVLLQVMGGGGNENPPDEVVVYPSISGNNASERRISVTQFESLCSDRFGVIVNRSNGGGGGGWSSTECCVCLNGFEGEEEVSELACKHFFHKNCLEKWLDHKHSNCPLCRSPL